MSRQAEALKDIAGGLVLTAPDNNPIRIAAEDGSVFQTSCLRQRTFRREPFDLGDDLFAEAIDRFQRKARVHARKIHHEPHHFSAQLFVLRQYLLDHFERASEIRRSRLTHRSSDHSVRPAVPIADSAG